MATIVHVVDDDPLVTQSLGTALRLETGYEVQAHTSGASALTSMVEHPPDVLITDFKMPGMDGLQLLRATRQAYPDAVLILLTGYADKESAIRAINDVGIWQYVEKPWVLDDLLIKVHSGLERRNLTRKLDAANRELLREHAEQGRALASLERAHGELKAAHERLVEAERLSAVGRVVSGIAHEIGNQLALVGYAQAIKEKVKDGDPEVAEFAGVIVSAHERLAAMVAEIKDFARGQESSPLEREPADVVACVEAALTILRYDREVARCKLISDLTAGPLARLHRGKFTQVVINLVRNAAQASPPGAEIVVRVWQEDDEVMVEVEDHGAGMPPELLARVGEPFFTTRGERGTGLGLSISRRIVQEHRGRLDLSSRPGVGTRARIVLPPLETP
jgi:signal transduction histidine kinase